ncbi:acyltransferase [Companilactobacillus pabuli]|uniref:Acyltransferase family protein n=1 Tax=Companilactobacillus pabuli TaxID=2714036 RepID=A0A7L7KU46_9LACO|nr:acyltransferase family protein [Companilactobacillus pabuli]AKP03259.1 hypothetical protein ABB45_06220 [Companilactobacillus farciminis]AKS51559.1 hypothetical protein ABB44_06230 [Companilactobacillus farciminis]QMT83333.1 acyltransferase family protein [Companilactobacillus pabuli]GAQ02427.1 hypothetical protein JCM14202_3212 [Companilactobacillus farciminis]
MDTKRNSAIELVRILSMFLIILGHFAVSTSWNFSDKSNLILISFIHSFWIGGKLGVNLFVLISGYFLISSKFRRKSFFNVWYTSYFYMVLVLIFAIFMNIGSITYKDIIKTIFLSSSGYLSWFVTAYLLMYLLSPFVNKLLLNLNKKEFRRLLAILILFFSIFNTLFHNPSLSGSNNGDDVVWLLVVYCCGAYIGKYRNDFLKITNKTICLSLITSLAISMASVFMLDYLKQNVSLLANKNNVYDFFIKGFSPLQLFSSICVFILFIKMPYFYSKKINLVSSTAFATYLLHANLLISGWIYNDIVRGYRFENSPIVLIYGVISSIGIFAVCFLISMILRGIFGKLNKKIINRISNLKIWNWFDSIL